MGIVKRLKPKAPSKTAQKSHYRAEYRAIHETLREMRLEAGLPQIDLAERLGRSQNFVSQAELGYKRLDGLQLWDWTHACGRDMEQFGKAIEAGIRQARKTVANSQAEQPATRTKKLASKTKEGTTRSKVASLPPAKRKPVRG